MLNRNDYLDLIQEIRNTEKKSIDQYILEVLEPLRAENENFIETLYKDIHYLIKDIDKKGENDLEIKNGSFVIEDGELKLTGYQSRLHNLALWLHMEMIEKFMSEDPFKVADKMESFENNFLKKPNYTPEYKIKLDELKKSLRKERKQNLGEKGDFWGKVNDLDNFELKPNIAGLGLNLNNLIDNFRNK